MEVATGPEGVAAGISAGAQLILKLHCNFMVCGVMLQTAQLLVLLWTGKGYVDVSTIDVSSAQQIAEAIRGAGAQYLEAPVSGSKQPAEKGQLIFLTGGGSQFLACCGHKTALPCPAHSMVASRMQQLLDARAHQSHRHLLESGIQSERW